jgi:PKD repeat protein
LDENYNDYEGWYIDDVNIFGLSENGNQDYSPISIAGADQILSDSDNDGYEEILLDGSGSYDPDGHIVSYEWKLGETVISSSVSFTQNFDVGNHIVSLTVTDNDSLTDTDYISITVEPNQIPVAIAGPNQVVTVGETVNFDGSDSYDTDGDIVSYIWDFGDGYTENGDKVNHIYQEEGSYSVLLTVIDNGGEVSNDLLTVDVELPVSFDASIYYHSVNSRWDRKNNIGMAEIKLKLTVTSGTSDQLIIKEITDETTNWALQDNKVVLKINKVRFKLDVTFDEFDNAVINLGSQGFTLNAGDEIEISKLKLYYDSRGWHTLTAVLINNGVDVVSDVINFK